MNRRSTDLGLPRRALAAAALAAALVATPARAQRRETAPPTPRAAKLDVPLPPPPPGTRLEPRGATFGVAVGPWAAFDTGKSIALHADYGLPRTPPGWGKLELEGRVAVTVARPAEETPLTRVVQPPYGPPVLVDAGSEETRVWLVEVVPTARLRLPLGTGFALYADGGVGLVQTVERYDRVEMFQGHVVKRQNVTGLVFRLGGGFSLDVTERVRVLFAPIALSFHAGPKFSGFAPSLGVAYRP